MLLSSEQTYFSEVSQTYIYGLQLQTDTDIKSIRTILNSILLLILLLSLGHQSDHHFITVIKSIMIFLLLFYI